MGEPLAQTPAEDHRVSATRPRPAEVTPRGVDQKAQMVEKMLFNSPVAARVAGVDPGDILHVGDDAERAQPVHAAATVAQEPQRPSRNRTGRERPTALLRAGPRPKDGTP